MNKDPESMMKLGEDCNELFEKMVTYCMSSGEIDQNLYVEYDVKRGLRDSTGKGVLTGLTEISDVVGAKLVDGVKMPAPGKLYYQGYDVEELLSKDLDERYAFEEATYLLLFGELPNKKQLDGFIKIITDLQELSANFIREVILHNPSVNIMNSLQKAILSLYSYDDNPEDTSVSNVLRQCLQIISKMPMIAVYAYHGYRHFNLNKNLIIRNPKKEYSIAENILNMLRPDGKFSVLEARCLDVALVLHAEHGGGNNSTFTTHVVTSSGTDTYSAIAASIASLKGPKHGGANLKVQQMFVDIQKHVKDWNNEEELKVYLEKILDKQAFDKAGLIYGMGHAVYTESDPRELVLKELTRKLADEKGRSDEFRLYDTVEQISGKIIGERRRLYKPVCANVDFYSGFMYSMLNIPEELFTPIFATARISGWSAHRLEELVNKGKIIRPAYKYVGAHRDYYSMEERFW